MSEVVGRQSETVREMALGDELSLFDSATGRAVALNSTARDVWALADGQTSVVEVIDTLARAYGVPPEDIADDVRRTLDLLAEAGVIVPTA